jgi:hypothetical protein
MAGHGLRRRERGVEVYVMCEIPSNVFGADRDSEILAPLFDERHSDHPQLSRFPLERGAGAG